MRFTTYSKYKGGWLDALNLQSLLEHLSDFLMDGGFAGGPHYNPYWGWSGDEDVNSTGALKNALLKALLESGQLTEEMIGELRGEGEGDEEIRQQIAQLLDDLVERMVEEGYINLETGNPQMPGATYDVTGQGKIDEAIEDSITCHRLGRLIGQGPFLVDSLVGIAIDLLACQADVMAAHYGKLPAEKIKTWRQQLQGLAPLPSVVERINVGERFSYLDVTFGIVRFGPSALDQLDEMGGASEDKKPGFKDVVSKAVLNTMSDWDDVMRRGNRWYDELVVAGRKPTYQERMTAFAEIDQKLEELARSAADPKKLLPLLLARDKGPGKVLSSLLSDILLSMMLPSVGKATVAEDRLVMNNRLVDVAFGLAAYRQETGQYPVQLEQLVPKYLAKIPEDLFVGKPVRYRRKAQGYLLYSVGPNQKDNGGQREDQELDDIGFQVPLPQ